MVGLADADVPFSHSNMETSKLDPPHVSSLVREHMGAWQPGSVRTFESAVCSHRAAHIRQRSSASFPTN